MAGVLSDQEPPYQISFSTSHHSPNLPDGGKLNLILRALTGPGVQQALGEGPLVLGLQQPILSTPRLGPGSAWKPGPQWAWAVQSCQVPMTPGVLGKPRRTLHGENPQPLPLTQATERHLPGVYVQRGLALPTSAPQEQAGADLRRGQEARGPQGSLKAPLLGEWLKALS